MKGVLTCQRGGAAEDRTLIVLGRLSREVSSALLHSPKTLLEKDAF